MQAASLAMQLFPQGFPLVHFFCVDDSMEQLASLAMHVLPQALPVLQFFASTAPAKHTIENAIKTNFIESSMSMKSSPILFLKK